MMKTLTAVFHAVPRHVYGPNEVSLAWTLIEPGLVLRAPAAELALVAVGQGDGVGHGQVDRHTGPNAW